MASKPKCSHVGPGAMIKLYSTNSHSTWWQESQWKGVVALDIPREWKGTIAGLVKTISSQWEGQGTKTLRWRLGLTRPKIDIVARKFIESVWRDAQAGASEGNNLSKMSENMMSKKFYIFADELYDGAKADDFGADAAFKVWKEIIKEREKLFGSQTLNGKSMTEHNKYKYWARFKLAFDLDVLNAVLTRALNMQKENAHKKYKKNVGLVVFIALLIIAASILVYSQKKVYRFARTQFRKIMDTWRRFRGRPAIHDTLEKLESSGRVVSPGANREMSIDEALRAIEMGNGFRTKSQSPSYSRTSSYRGSRAGSSSPVTKKSPKQKFKWIEFHVGTPKQNPKTKTTRR